MRRYPIEPLERLIRARLLDRLEVVGTKTIAVELGEDPNTIYRAREHGLRREAAERLAGAAGYLAEEVWPEIIDHDIEELTVKCEAPDCPVEFVAPIPGWGQKRRRYCTRTCQVRTNKRRHRENPEQRAKENMASRRYKQEVAEAARRRAEPREVAA